MSAAGIDWEQLPDAVVEAFIERLHLVEMLLDPLLPEADILSRRVLATLLGAVWHLWLAGNNAGRLTQKKGPVVRSSVRQHFALFRGPNTLPRARAETDTNYAACKEASSTALRMTP